MSTILKALRRLESDRGQPRRSLREEVMGGETAEESRTRPPASQRTGAAWLAVGLLLVVAGGLAAVIPLLIDPEPEHVAATPSRRSAPIPPASTARSTPPPAAPERPARPAPGPGPTREPGAALARTATPPESAPPSAPVSPPTGAPPSAGAEPGPPSAVGPAAPPDAVPEPSRPAPAQAAPERVTVAAVPGTASEVVAAPSEPEVAVPSESAARTEPATVPEAEPPAASEPEVARVERASLPEVRVASTVWHPKSERRIARIELVGEGRGLVELREGDAVGSFVVARIEPSAVLFRQGQVEIRRRVGQ